MKIPFEPRMPVEPDKSQFYNYHEVNPLTKYDRDFTLYKEDLPSDFDRIDVYINTDRYDGVMEDVVLSFKIKADFNQVGYDKAMIKYEKDKKKYEVSLKKYEADLVKYEAEMSESQKEKERKEFEKAKKVYQKLKGKYEDS